MRSTVIFVLALAAFNVHGYPQGQTDSEAAPSQDDDSDMYLEPDKAPAQETQQSFYPSFPPFENPPLGHSRPFYYQPEAAYSQRPQSGYQQQQVAYDSPRFSGYKDDSYSRASANADSHGILGSGNFGVIRGGTFYDNDGDSSNHYEQDYNNYFKNGHGRPSFYFGGVPNPRPYQHEQFENFRDFADINTPSNPAYSQYVVVYVNKNGTKHEEGDTATVKRPKNIIESLAMLDLETPAPKKVSKSKAKLAKVLPEKKWKVKKSSDKKLSRELHEPLLALS